MKIRSVKFNFIMNFILTASSIIFPLITAPYIFRVLQPEASGKVDFVASVITYFMMFASLGIPTYGIRACAKVRDDRDKLSKTVQELMIINTVTMCITYGVFLILLRLVPQFYAEKELFLINSISMVLNVIGVAWFYNAIEQYAYITTVSIICKVISIIFMFLLVKSPEDYIVYGGITVFAGSASYIVNFLNLRRYISFRKKGAYEFQRHFKPILVFFAMTAAISVYTNLDIVMTRFISGNTEVGYYTAAIKVKTLLVTFITSLGTVLLPRLTYLMKDGENKAFQKIIIKAFNFVLIIGLSVTVYFTLYAKESILILAGIHYDKSVLPMQILMPAVLFIGLSNITGIQILTPRGEERKVLYSILWGAGINFILNMILIRLYGAAGAALATLVAEGVVLMVQGIYLRETLKEILPEISFLQNLLASALSIGLVWFFMRFVDLNAFLTMVVSACIFFGTYLIVLVITKEKFTMDILHGLLERRKR